MIMLTDLERLILAIHLEEYRYHLAVTLGYPTTTVEIKTKERILGIKAMYGTASEWWHL